MEGPFAVSNVTLSELKEGALEERWQQALKQVLVNVEDPNTSAEAVREIKITVKVKPTGDRSMVMIDAVVAAKLATAIPVATALILKHDEKGAVRGDEPIQDPLPYSQRN